MIKIKVYYTTPKEKEEANHYKEIIHDSIDDGIEDHPMIILQRLKLPQRHDKLSSITYSIKTKIK